MRTTKEEVFSGKRKELAPVPVNAALAKKLAVGKPGGAAITDQASCLNRVKPLDLRRTAVQKAGGMWHAFERNADARPHASIGMQLDSSSNKVIHLLMHLCRTAEGVPLTDFARQVSKNVETYGRDGAGKILLDKGEHPDDVVKMLDYAALAKKETTRKVDLQAIGKLIERAEPLIDLYEVLSHRSVDAKTLDAFLSDSATLLQVINEFIGNDPLMVMALKEDTQVLYTHPDQDM